MGSAALHGRGRSRVHGLVLGLCAGELATDVRLVPHFPVPAGVAEARVVRHHGGDRGAPRRVGRRWSVIVRAKDRGHVGQRDERRDAAAHHRQDLLVEVGEVVGDGARRVLVDQVVEGVVEEVVDADHLQADAGDLAGLLREPVQVLHGQVAALGAVEQLGRADGGAGGGGVAGTERSRAAGRQGGCGGDGERRRGQHGHDSRQHGCRCAAGVRDSHGDFQQDHLL